MRCRTVSPQHSEPQTDRPERVGNYHDNPGRQGGERTHALSWSVLGRCGRASPLREVRDRWRGESKRARWPPRLPASRPGSLCRGRGGARDRRPLHPPRDDPNPSRRTPILCGQSKNGHGVEGHTNQEATIEVIGETLGKLPYEALNDLRK